MPADSQAQQNDSSHTSPHGGLPPGERKNISINLSGKPKESTGSIFYKWAINIGRIVIVLTELVALSALFYRFVIDRQIADINDQISTQVLLIRSNEQKEKQFRGVQDKLSMIKVIKEDTDAKINVMNKVLDTSNSGIFSTNNLSVNKNIISLNGVASSIFSIDTFVEELKTNEYVTSISLDEITSTDTGILFKLQITLVGLPEDDTQNQQPAEALL